MSALLGALVLALAPAAPAVSAAMGDESRRIGDDLDARVWCPWPESAHKGWVPVFVELENRGEEPLRVRIDATCEDPWTDREVRSGIELAPHEDARLELLVPMGGTYWNGFTVRVGFPGHDYHFNGVVGSNSVERDRRQVLVLGATRPRPGEVERWGAALSTKAVGSTAMFRPVPTLPGTTVFGTSTTTGSTPNDVDVAFAGFDALPRHHGAYSSLDLVVLDPSGGMPPAAELAPLAAWVRTGGDLLVIGERGWEAARAVPELAAWMEPRFEENGALGSEYRCGLGRLFVGDAEGELGDEYKDWVKDALAYHAGLTPTPGAWRVSVLPVIPGLEMLPVRTFVVLLMLFAVAIGPVNFFWVWKRKRPVLLLATIPAIALGTTAALLAYGILFQGLDVKTASRSLAVLDQRAHRASSVELRELYAGLAPAAGLALDAGTIVHHRKHAGGHSGIRHRRFTAELGAGLELGGDFLPSRKAVSQVLAVDRAERARLDVRRSGGGLAVDNNLGSVVDELYLRDPEGDFHRLEEPLAPGASATLRPVDSLALRESLKALLHEDVRAAPGGPSYPEDMLPAGCYAARLAASPFRDACGIETNELESRHAVLGVLDLDAEGWR